MSGNNVAASINRTHCVSKNHEGETRVKMSQPNVKQNNILTMAVYVSYKPQTTGGCNQSSTAGSKVKWGYNK